MFFSKKYGLQKLGVGCHISHNLLMIFMLVAQKKFFFGIPKSLYLFDYDKLYFIKVKKTFYYIKVTCQFLIVCLWHISHASDRLMILDSPSTIICHNSIYSSGIEIYHGESL